MILTIDVGIRNLALCAMNSEKKNDLKTYQIYLWNTFNLLEDDNKFCQTVIKKTNKICNCKCAFQYKNEGNLIYSCKKHIPKEFISSSTNYKKKTIQSLTLQEIAKLVINQIQTLFVKYQTLFLQLKEILIELQPKVNPKMKFVSHVIYTKLTDLLFHHKTSIRFVGASKKLKIKYTGPELTCMLKGEYAKRKWLSIQYTRWFLEKELSTEFASHWCVLFQQTDKQDDMADVFLMCINQLYGILSKSKK